MEDYVGSKVCKDCKERKSIEEFYEQVTMFDGYLNVCKKCSRTKQIERNKKKWKKKK